MRFTGAVACVIVALDCAQKASGNEAQQIFSSESVWVWWLFAVWWGFAAIRLIVD